MKLHAVPALLLFAACAPRPAEPNAEIAELRERLAVAETRLERAQADIETLKTDVRDVRLLGQTVRSLTGSSSWLLDPAPDVPPPLAPNEVAPNEFAVARELLTTGEGFPGEARVMPKMGDDGTIVGLKVYGIRPGSAARAMGLKNGDLLLSVDGAALDSRDALLELGKSLSMREQVKLDIERKGEKRTITVKFQ